MAVIRIDGNNDMYPIAYAVVEAETRDSWSWFMGWLLEGISDAIDHGWIIMSDRQKV